MPKRVSRGKADAPARTSLSLGQPSTCFSCGTVVPNDREAYEVLPVRTKAQRVPGSTLFCSLCGLTIVEPTSTHMPSSSRVTVGLADWALMSCLPGLLSRLPDCGIVVHLEITRLQRNKVLLSVTRRPNKAMEYTYTLDTHCLAPVSVRIVDT